MRLCLPCVFAVSSRPEASGHFRRQPPPDEEPVGCFCWVNPRIGRGFCLTLSPALLLRLLFVWVPERLISLWHRPPQCKPKLIGAFIFPLYDADGYSPHRCHRIERCHCGFDMNLLLPSARGAIGAEIARGSGSSVIELTAWNDGEMTRVGKMAQQKWDDGDGVEGIERRGGDRTARR